MAGLFNFTSCTEDNLAEVTNTPEDHYANGEDGHIDPDEEKPGGD